MATIRKSPRRKSPSVLKKITPLRKTKTPVSGSAFRSTRKTKTPVKPGNIFSRSVVASSSTKRKSPKPLILGSKTPVRKSSPSRTKTPGRTRGTARKTTPGRATPARKTTPGRATPARKTTPGRATPARKTTPGRATPARKTTPGRATPARKTTPGRATPARKTTPGRATPSKLTPVRKSIRNNLSVLKPKPAAPVASSRLSLESRPFLYTSLSICAGLILFLVFLFVSYKIYDYFYGEETTATPSIDFEADIDEILSGDTKQDKENETEETPDKNQESTD